MIASVGSGDGPAGAFPAGLAVRRSAGAVLVGRVAGGQQRRGDGHRDTEQAEAPQRLTTADDAVGVVLDDLFGQIRIELGHGTTVGGKTR